MNQLSFRTVGEVKPDGIAGVIKSMLSRSSDGVVTIAPGIAKRIIEETNFSGQRRVNLARVGERVHDIENGRWKERVTPITFAQTPDGKLYLVNGQHRCHAIAKSGRAVPALVVIDRAADLAAVRSLYALFDTPESRRSDTDMLDGVGIAAGLGVKRKTAAAVFKALSILRNDMEIPANSAGADATSRNGRLEDIMDWADEARVFERIVAQADTFLQRKLYSASAAAFALYVLRHRRADAVDFLTGLAENDGLRKSDPRARLIADFQNRPVNVNSSRQGLQRFAVAWNAWVEKRDLTIIKCNDGAAIVIKGTPKGKAGAR